MSTVSGAAVPSEENHGQKGAALHYFGDYELLEEIARGGMGVVYKARQVSLNRIVAVKMLLFGKMAGDDFVRRFRAEAEVAASLQHPNIVAIHEVGEHDGQQYFSMDYVEGSDLAALVRDKSLPSTLAATYLKTTAEAIHYAHQQGVLHRDLKPANILIDASGQPRITDFGLAKRLHSNLELTMTGQVLGTPHYMSPEQAGAKFREVTPLSDVYSLGAIFYHLLTGRAPFLADTPEAALAQLLQNDPAPLRLLNANVPRDLETICLKCLSKEPPRRYASARALADDLGRWLNGQPIHARPVGPPEMLWRWSRRHPVVAWLVIALHVVLILGLIGILWQWSRAEHNAQTAAAQKQLAEQHAAAEAAQRARAEVQAKTSKQVSQYLSDMLLGVQPHVAMGKDTALLREILNKTVTRLADDFKNQPEVQAELRKTMGEAFLSLGDPEKAEQMLMESLRLRMTLLGPDNRDTLDSKFALARAVREQGRQEQSAKLLRETLDSYLRLYGENDLKIVEILNGLAAVSQTHGEAESALRHSLAILDRLGATNHVLRGFTLQDLARKLQLQERLLDAEPIWREALAIHRGILGDSDPATARCRREFANLLRELKKFDEAEAVIRDSLPVLRKVYGEHDPMALSALLQLAQINIDRRDEIATRSLLSNVVGTVSGWTNQFASAAGGWVASELGYCLTEETRRAWDTGDKLRARECALQAEKILRRLLELREVRISGDGWLLVWTRSLFAGALIAAGTADFEARLADRVSRFKEAESILMGVFEKFSSQHYPNAETAYHNLAPTQERLVALYLRWEEVAASSGHAEKLAEWRRRLDELEQNAGRKGQPRMSERYTGN